MRVSKLQTGICKELSAKRAAKNLRVRVKRQIEN